MSDASRPVRVGMGRHIYKKGPCALLPMEKIMCKLSEKQEASKVLKHDCNGHRYQPRNMRAGKSPRVRTKSMIRVPD